MSAARLIDLKDLCLARFLEDYINIYAYIHICMHTYIHIDR